MNPFFALLFRDIRLAVRAGGGAALALAFFACVVTLVPLGVGADMRLLARIAGGVLWVAAVLAALLSLDRLFQADYEDGSLDLIALSSLSLEVTALAKTAAHWLATGLPLTALAALFASGVIGRTVHRAGSAGNEIVADAGFGISKLHLAGNVRTAPVTILAALGFEPGQSIFTADLPAARARLLRLPWIAGAEVKRRYPDDIGVRIVEKQPFARYQSPKGLYVVERSGGLITDKDLGPFRNLPLLAGDGAETKIGAILSLHVAP